MTETAVDRLLRLTGSADQAPSDEGDDLRRLIYAARLSLDEALTTPDPRVAAELVLAAFGAINGLAEMMYAAVMPDTSGSQIGMAMQRSGVEDSCVALAVLTTAERKKPSAHTIPGSDDYPIPDKAHLTAALGRYHAGQYAGHSKEEVAAHIRSRAKALGVTVNLAQPTEIVPVLMALARGAAVVPNMAVEAEHHAPMHGTHSHRHSHNNDSSHGYTGWSGSHMPGAQGPGRQHMGGTGWSGDHMTGHGSPGHQHMGGTGWTNVELAGPMPPSEMHSEEHGKMTGTHGHAHTHYGDNMHGGQADQSPGEQAYAAKGAKAWAQDRQNWQGGGGYRK